MPTDIERLRGLLAAGTAGPWRAEPSCDEDENVYWSEDLNAPVWLVATPLTNDTATWLIEHIRESDATLITETINALPSLLDEVERLREALYFYADEVNYDCGPGDVSISDYPVMEDWGKCARNALA